MVGCSQFLVMATVCSFSPRKNAGGFAYARYCRGAGSLLASPTLSWSRPWVTGSVCWLQNVNGENCNEVIVLPPFPLSQGKPENSQAAPRTATVATDAKSPCPFPGRRKGARPNPIYNEKPRNCGVTLIATAVPGMGYKGILPKRACRMVFAYFLPKQKVGNPRRTAGGGELSPAKKHPA